MAAAPDPGATAAPRRVAPAGSSSGRRGEHPRRHRSGTGGGQNANLDPACSVRYIPGMDQLTTAPRCPLCGQGSLTTPGACTACELAARVVDEVAAEREPERLFTPAPEPIRGQLTIGECL
jgi:hypothetical protein